MKVPYCRWFCSAVGVFTLLLVGICCAGYADEVEADHNALRELKTKYEEAATGASRNC